MRLFKFSVPALICKTHETSVFTILIMAHLTNTNKVITGVASRSAETLVICFQENSAYKLIYRALGISVSKSVV
jgi:hypothetical protein